MTTSLEGRGFGLRRAECLRPYTAERSLLQRLALRAGLILFVSLFCLVYGFGYALTTPFLIVPFMIPLVVLMMLVIWALPDTDRAPTGLVVVLTYALFLALFLWPNYLALSLPGLPWITMIRLIGAPLFLALLICTSMSPTFRRTVAESLTATPWIWKPLVAFAILMTLSVGLSDSIAGSLQKLIVYLLSWIVVFFAAVYAFRRAERIALWTSLILFVVTVLVTIGLWEQRVGGVLWRNSIPSFLKVEDESVQRVLAGFSRSAIGIHRVQGTSSTPLGMAEFLALSSPFILHIAISARWLVVRAYAAALLPLMVLVILATDSRLGLVGMLFGTVVYLLIWGVQRWRRSRGDIIGPAVTLAYPIMLVLIFAATMFIGRIRNEVWGTGAQQASNEGRMAQIENGIPLILKNPFGYGVGQAADELGMANAAGVITIDNYYLALALDYGVIGFALYACAFIAGAVYAFKGAVAAVRSTDKEAALFTPLAAALIVFLVTKSVFSQVDNHAFAFMMLGAVVALTARVRALTAAAGSEASVAPATKARRRTVR